jgi:polyisoprenyl-teichoic acid--peptidoglycan teichoic acid transferase
MAPPRSSSALEDPPRPAPSPEAAPRRRRRSWRQRTLLGVGIVAVFGIMVAIAGVGYGIWRYSQLHKEKLNLASASAGGPENYLIVGSDSRSVINKSDPNYKVFEGGPAAPDGGQRSDTIMVLRIDPRKHTAKLLSFPRDLWVPIYGTGANQRINTAYNSGPQQLIDTIQQDFNIPINHYIEVNFASFQDVVNAVGGVPMWFDTPMRDNNSGLNITTTGCVLMNGEQALEFARSRELEYQTASGRWRSDGTGDLGRITRQQIFIRKVIDRAKAKATGLNVLATNDLLESVIKNLKVDNNFSLGDMLTLLSNYKAFDSNQLATYTLPTTPHVTAGGADVLLLQQNAAQPTLDAFRTKSTAPSTVKPSEVTLSIENGTGITGQASHAATDLGAYGFTVTSTGNAAATGQTTVYYGSGAQAQAQAVASYIEGNAQVTADSSLTSGQVQLIIGQDFQGITAQSPSGSASSTTGAGATTGSTGATPTTQPIGRTPGQPPPGVSC